MLKYILLFILIELIRGNYDCDSSSFKCNVSDVTRCISKEWVCDSYEDCDGGLDEMNCTKLKCKSDEEKCKYSNVCIKKRNLCDGKMDCPDKSDESNCKNDLKNCEHNNNCTQVCNFTLSHGVICGCYENYKFKDGKCIPNSIESEIHLLYINKNKIMDRNIITNVEKILVRSSSEIVTFNGGLQNENLKLYSSFLKRESLVHLKEFVKWMDVETNAKSGIGASRNFSTDSSIYSLAVDHYRNLLFWTDSTTKSVRVMNISSGDYLTLVKDLHYPVDIQINPITEKIYWIDRDTVLTKARIMAANYDGTNVTWITHFILKKPSCITIDVVHNHLYWADVASGAIFYMDLNRNNVPKKVLQNLAFEPSSIALYKNKIFWSDHKQNRIYSVDKFSGSNIRSIVQTFRPGLIQLYSGDSEELVKKLVKATINYNKRGCSYQNECRHSCISSNFSLNKYVCFGSEKLPAKTNHLDQKISHSSYWWLFILPIAAILLVGLMVKGYYRVRRPYSFTRTHNAASSETATATVIYDNVKFWEDGDEDGESPIIALKDTDHILT